MLQQITSFLRSLLKQKSESDLAAENFSKSFKKGTTLLEPYIILCNRTPYSDKDAMSKIFKGIEYLDMAIKIDPYNYAPVWFKGKAYQVLEQHENAYAQFERAFELNKGNPDVARELMLECLDLGKGQQAVDLALYALSLNGDDAGMVSNLALAYLFNGELDLAGQTIEAAILASPEDVISQRAKKIINEVISGKRAQPHKFGDLNLPNYA